MTRRMAYLVCQNCHSDIATQQIQVEWFCDRCAKAWREAIKYGTNWSAPLPDPPPQLISDGWLAVICLGVIGLIALLGYTVYLVWG